MNIQAICDGIARLARPERKSWKGFVNIANSSSTDKKDVVRFNGAYVPELRKLAQSYYQTLSLDDVAALLRSKLHEERVCAVLCLVCMYSCNSQAVYEFYVAHSELLDYWDLIDLSAHKIPGEYLQNRPREDFMQLSDSQNWWQRRIPMVASWRWIRDRDFKWTLRLARKYRMDPHHYVQRAAGWMLREVGKVDRAVLRNFMLEAVNHPMRNITISYATEHFPGLKDQALSLSRDIG